MTVTVGIALCFLLSSLQGCCLCREEEGKGSPCSVLTCSLVCHQLAHFTLHCSEGVARGLLCQEPRPPQVGEGQQVLGAIALQEMQVSLY